jgi:hypothetical protein
MQPDNPYGAPQAAAPAVDVRSKVSLPATLILVSQVIGLVIQLASMAFKSQIVAAVKSYMESTGKPFPANAMDSNPLLAILGIAGSCFVIYAMLEMKKVRRFPVAVVGAILAMLPFLSLCCFLGFPLGVWALIVLFNPDVRAAFT